MSSTSQLSSIIAIGQQSSTASNIIYIKRDDRERGAAT